MFIHRSVFESNDGLNWNYVEVDEKINAIASNDLWTTNNFAGTPTNLLRNTFAIGNNGYLLRNSEATGNASISTNEDIDIQVYPNPASEKVTIKMEDAQQWNLTIVDANMKEIKGPCGTSKDKKNPDRCLPLAKARSLSKRQLAATARKKKKAGARGKTVVSNTKAAKVRNA